MKRKQRSPKAGTRTTGAPRRRTGPMKRAEPDRLSGPLEEVLSLIKAHPGIRPSELNRLLKREQSDALRDALVKRGLIRKQKDGSAMRYYAVD
jgi:uncharacterized membrane protein